MTDRSDLEARLTRLAKDERAKMPEPGAAAGRVIVRVSIQGEDADLVLRAILQTIDETVLPARLVLTSEAEARLALSVGARRLRAVEAASEPLQPGDLPGRALEPEDDTSQTHLADLVRRFAEGARGDVVVTEAPGTAGGGRGLSVARLTAQWAPAPDDSDRPIADRFASRCGSRLKACLIRTDDGQPDRMLGDRGMGEMLDGLAGMVLPNVADAPAGPMLRLWLRKTGALDGTAFGLARWPGQQGASVMAVFAFATAETSAISAIFHALQAD